MNKRELKEKEVRGISLRRISLELAIEFIEAGGLHVEAPQKVVLIAKDFYNFLING